MSRKNRTAATTVADDDRHLHAVPEQPRQQNTPTAEDKVRAALADNPGSTTAALVIAAGVGRSTAAKILARWGRDGTAIRITGDSPRNPDTWTMAPSDNTGTAPEAADTPTDTTATSNATDTEDTAPVAEPATTSGTEGKHSTDEETTDNGAAASDEIGAGADATSAPPESEPFAPAPCDTDDEADPRGDVPPADAEFTDAAPGDKNRLPKGGLRALVEEYLAEHPNESFGPAKIGTDLGRSGGAVNNALEKLVADGYALKTCEAPKRFAINPDKTDVPTAPIDAE